MSTKRKVIDRTKPPGGGGKITPEILAVFKKLLEVERSDDDCEPEFRNLCNRLDMLLGFGEPWDRFSPARIHGKSHPPKWMPEHERADWDRAIAVRRELEQAAAEGG